MTDSPRPADTLREQCKRARMHMTSSERATASRRIADRFVASRFFLSAQAIACYISAPDEVDTSAIIDRAWRANKRIFAPVVSADGAMFFRALRPESTLVRNRFGLWEPESGQIIRPQSLDIVVTPLVAFDRDSNRIGMGGGYFDRAFAFLRNRKTWRRPKLIGLAFDCQEVKKIASNPWDIRLFCVLTETS